MTDMKSKTPEQLASAAAEALFGGKVKQLKAKSKKFKSKKKKFSPRAPRGRKVYAQLPNTDHLPKPGYDGKLSLFSIVRGAIKLEAQGGPAVSYGMAIIAKPPKNGRWILEEVHFPKDPEKYTLPVTKLVRVARREGHHTAVLIFFKRKDHPTVFISTTLSGKAYVHYAPMKPAHEDKAQCYRALDSLPCNMRVLGEDQEALVEEFVAFTGVNPTTGYRTDNAARASRSEGMKYVTTRDNYRSAKFPAMSRDDGDRIRQAIASNAAALH